MTRRPLLLFALALLLLLLFQFRGLLAPGHSLYLSIIDDPGAWWSWYPWDVFSLREFRAGRFPLWNHLSGAGFPHLANFASTPFSPFKWLFYLFPHYRVLDAMIFLRPWLAGIFTFLFLRRLRLSAAAAATGALAFALSGYVMEYVNIFNLATEMWLPAALYLWEGQREKATLRRFLLLALVSALALTGGNPEAAFYYLLFLALYALAHGPMSPGAIIRRWLTALAPAVAAGFLITAQGLPLVEYLSRAWHVHTGDLHALAQFQVRDYWSLFFPWLVGPNHTSPAQVFLLPYLGITVSALAALAWLHRPTGERTLLFFLLYTGVMLGLIFDLPPFSLLGEIPPFKQSGNFKFAMAGITLAVACSAAFGVQFIQTAPTRSAKRDRRTAVAQALLTALAFAGIGLGWKNPSLPPVQTAGWLAPLLLLLILNAAVRLARGRSSAAWFFAALVTLDLLLLYPGLRPAGKIAPAAVRPLDPIGPAYLDPVRQDPGRFRYTGSAEIIHHSLNLLYEANDLRAFEALYPRDYVAVFSQIEKFPLADAVAAFFDHGWSFDVRPENLGDPRLDRLGVKYYLSEREVAAPGWELLQTGPVRVYRNTEVHPRAYLKSDERPRLPADLAEYGSQRVVLRTDSPALSFLVLSDIYLPGWRAWVDGREKKIVNVPPLSRGVALSAGKHTVEMLYRPWGFRLGLWGSLVSLAALMAVAGVGKRG